MIANDFRIVRDYISYVKTAVNADNRDTNLQNQFVYSVLDSVRKDIINREAKYGSFRRLSELKTLPEVMCMETVKITELVTSCGGFGDTVMRSVEKIPSYVTSRNSNLLTVSNRLMTTVYNYEEPISIGNLIERDRFVRKKSNFYFIEDGKIVIPNNTIQEILVRRVAFETDLVVGCQSPLDMTFIIPEYCKKELLDSTIQAIMSSTLSIPKDEKIDNIPNGRS